MKKVTLAIAMAALALFTGCKKDNETQGTTLKASIEQNKGDGSRTSLNPTNGAILWTAGDKILVSNGTSSATFTLASGQGTANGTFSYNGEFELGESNMAVYPHTASINGNTIGVTLPETQTLTTSGTFGNGANPMLAVSTDDNLTFTSLCGGLGISLTGDDIDITAIEIVSANANEKLNGTFECTTDEPTLVATAGNNGTNRIMLNCNATLTAEPQEFYIVLPVGVLAEGFTMNVYNGGEEPIFSKSTESTQLQVELNTVKTMNAVEVILHEYVDLSLPSGLLWATCNVGADTPEGYGDYFAWGETAPKDRYRWSNYQYCIGSSTTLTKYCQNSSYGYNGFTDELTTLEASDDAATVNWGSGWRMPTKAEFQELYNNTTVTWTQQNGVNGRLFTATDGSGNSLFLPAAGFRLGYNLQEAGSWGTYWSSSLLGSTPVYAWRFYIYSGGYSMYSDYDRSWGFPVRPVRSGE